MKDVILFDGDCGLCNRFVLSVIQQDPGRIFMFAPLSSLTGQRLLQAHGISKKIDSIVLVEDGRAHIRSQAVLRILQRLGIRRGDVTLLSLLPVSIADLAYRVIAASRKLFFRQHVCEVMSKDTHARFALD